MMLRERSSNHSVNYLEARKNRHEDINYGRYEVLIFQLLSGFYFTRK